jgi:hypothetical protein
MGGLAQVPQVSAGATDVNRGPVRVILRYFSEILLSPFLQGPEIARERLAHEICNL